MNFHENCFQFPEDRFEFYEHGFLFLLKLPWMNEDGFKLKFEAIFINIIMYICEQRLLWTSQ